MQIHYEPHPVSADRKAALRAKGLKIIDARFAPADWRAVGGLQEEEKNEAQTEAPVKRRRGRPRKAD